MLSLLPTPARLPPFSYILDNLGNPRPEAVARALGVSARSVRRWIAADHAPRAPMLALFWVTQWGRSFLDAHMHADLVLHVGWVRALRDELDRERARLLRVLEVAEFDSANDPLLQLPTRTASRARPPLAALPSLAPRLIAPGRNRNEA